MAEENTQEVNESSEQVIDVEKDIKDILGDDVVEESEAEEPEIVEEVEEHTDAPDVDDYEGGYIDEDGEYVSDEEISEPVEKAPESVEQKPEEHQEEEKTEPQSDDMKQKIIQNVAEKLDISEVPNTKEFRSAVISEAKDEVCRELGVEEYDNFDEEHQALFIEKLEAVRNRRKARFDATVKEVTENFERQDRIGKIKSQLEAICDTPEKLAELDKALGGVSYNTYRRMQEQIQNGNPEMLLDFAKNMFDKKKTIPQVKPQKKHNTQKRDRGFASDIVFGGY